MGRSKRHHLPNQERPDGRNPTGKPILSTNWIFIEADYAHEDVRSGFGLRAAWSLWPDFQGAKGRSGTSYDMVEGEIGELISMGNHSAVHVFIIFLCLYCMWC